MNSRFFRICTSITITALLCVALTGFLAQKDTPASPLASSARPASPVSQGQPQAPSIAAAPAAQPVAPLSQRAAASLAPSLSPAAPSNQPAASLESARQPGDTQPEAAPTIAQAAPSASAAQLQVNELAAIPPVFALASADLLTATAPATATITGPLSGLVGQSLPFTAAAAPISAGLPLDYRWQAQGQPEVQHLNLLSDTQSFAWSLPGLYQITVTISNTSGSASAVFTTTIQDLPISGLAAANNSPTEEGSPTYLTATQSGGTNIAYSWDFGDALGGTGAVISHTYAVPGMYTATLSAVNSRGVYTASTLVSVRHKPVIALSAISVSENQVFTATGSFFDPDSVSWLGSVDYGDGGGALPLALNPGQTFTLTHTYLDSGVYSVTVKLIDELNGAGRKTVLASVANLAPGALLTNNGPVNEGAGAVMSFSSSSDPSPIDAAAGYAYSYDFNNDGAYEVSNSPLPSAGVPGAYLPDGPASVVLRGRIADKDGGSSVYTSTIQVKNVAPLLSNVAISPANLTENLTATLSGQIVDPGLNDTFTLNVTWGDGATSSYNYPAGATGFSVKHRYLDDNPTGTPSDTKTVNLTLTDKDSGSAAASTSLTIFNAAPSLANVSISSAILENGTATLTGQIIDPGSQDSFTLSVTWGDGKSNNYLYPAGTTNFSQTHVYQDDNPSGTLADLYSVALVLTDDDTGSSSATTSLTVANVAPTLVGGTFNATNVNENGLTTLSGQISDPGSLDPFTMTVTWGDGASNNYLLPAGTTLFSKTHRYLDDNPTSTPIDPYLINLTIKDDDLGSVSASKTIQVSNVAPTLASLFASNVNENSSTTLTGQIIDPGSLDIFTMTVQWGDGQSNVYYFPAGTINFSKTHKYLDDDPTRTQSDLYTISINLLDDDKGQISTSTNLTVLDVSPTLSGLAATPIDENQITTLTGHISDPGTRDYFTMTVNWGDGSSSLSYYPASLLINGTFPFTLTHQYLDDNPTATAVDVTTINLSVQDDDARVGTGSVGQTVKNVAPSLLGVGITPVILENGTATLSGQIVDPGSQDSFALTVSWGDGTNSTTNFPVGTTTFQVTHVYLDDNPTNTSADSYAVNLTLKDDDTGQGSASTSLLVVNVSPTLTGLSATSVSENGISTLSGQIVDPGTKDTFSMIVAWGDGSSSVYSFPAGTKAFSKTHQYLDDNPTGTGSDPQTISIAVNDDDLGQGAGSTVLTVTNVPPALLNLSSTNVNENGSASLTGKISDPGSQDTFTLVVGWGDGVTDLVPYPAGTTNFTLTHQYLDDNPTGTGSDPFSIDIVAMDDDQGFGTGRTSLVVSNVIPTLANLSSTSISENNLSTLTGKIVDPGTQDTFTMTVNWGDGAANLFTYPAGTRSFTETHRYLDNGVYTQTLNIHDDDLGSSPGISHALFSNTAPALVGLIATNVNENGISTLSGRIVDPGSRDTFTMTITWGDGSTSLDSYPAGTTTFAKTHQYLDDNPTGTASDRYNISIEVQDKDKDKGTGAASLTVTNLNPALVNLAAADITENNLTTLSGKIVDPGSQDTFTMTVTWGDGSTSQYLFAAGTTNFSKTHKYLDDNPTGTTSDLYNISVVVRDDDLGLGSGFTSLRVANALPALTNVLITPSVLENNQATLTGNIVDPGTQDTFVLSVNWGDGASSQVPYPAGASNFSLNHTYADDKPSGTASDLYTVTLSVQDDDLGSGSAAAHFILHNTPPQLSNLSLTPSINESGVATLSGQIFDPGIQDTFLLTVTWGDGDTNVYALPAGSASFMENHAYLDDNPSATASDRYTVTLKLADDDLGVAQASASLQVKNTNPGLSGLSMTNINENGLSTLSGSVIDLGVRDTFTLTVNWGDGSISSYALPAGVSAFSKTHRYLDDNPSSTSSDTYTVNLQVQDDDLGSSTGQTSVKVTNVAPALQNVSATSISENSFSTLSGTIVDPGSQDTFSMFVTWGDGSNNTYTFPAGTTSFSKTHRYLDDNPSGTSSDAYTVNLFIQDDDLGLGSAQTGLTVSNVQPALLNLAATSVLENGSTTLTGSLLDPGTTDTFTMTVFWGDGNTSIYALPAGTTAFSKSHSYLDDNPTGTSADLYQVTVDLQDDDDGSVTAQANLTVSNVAPLLQNLAASDVDENSFSTLTGKIVDPGSRDTFTMTVAWGDGAISLFSLPAGSTTFSKSHQYLDDNPSGSASDLYLVSVQVQDDDLGQASASTGLTVSNVAPALAQLTVNSISENNASTVQGKIIDPGTQDSFSLTINWGDGSQQSLTYPAGTQVFSSTHTYLDDNPSLSSSDVYTLTLDLQDDDLGAAQYSANVTVSNTAPSLVNLKAQDISESGSTTLTGAIADPGSLDSFSLTIDWGDGNNNLYNLPAGTHAFTETHQYPDDNPSGTPADTYSIAVSLSDDDLGSASAAVPVLVSNIPPQVTLTTVSSVREGSAFSGSGSFTDPGADSWTATINYGDGLGDWNLPLKTNKTFNFTWSYDDSGDKPLRVAVHDDDLGVGIITQTIRVENVAPVGVFTATKWVNEGSTALVWFASTFDPSQADTKAGFRYSYDFNMDGIFDVTASAQPSATVPAYLVSNGPALLLVRGRIQDKDGGYNDYIARINILDLPPVAKGDAYSTQEDQALTISAPGVLANDLDVPADVLNAILLKNPTHGSLSLDLNGAFNYKPALNYNGKDYFTYQARSGSLFSQPAVVTITVVSVNDPPISAGDVYSTSEDTLLQVPAASGLLKNDSDPEKDPLTAVLFKTTQFGTLNLSSSGAFTYMPAQSFFGVDSFVYQSSDGVDLSLPTLVTITIKDMANEPIALDDAYSVYQSEHLDIPAPGVLANDTPLRGNVLYALLVSQPLHGDLLFRPDGSFQYTSNRTFVGEDSFTYAVRDAFGALSLPATVRITVQARPDDLFSYDYLLKTNPALPQVGALASLEMSVMRQGGSTVLSNRVEVWFYLDSVSPASLLSKTTLAALSPDSAGLTPPVAWIPSTPGVHTLIALIDPTNQVVETDETNNTIQRQVAVMPKANPIDQVKPVIQSFQVSQGLNLTNGVDISLDLSATDIGSKVTKALIAEFVYSQTLNAWTPVLASGWLPYSGATSLYPWKMSAAAGAHYFIAWVSDQYGNVSNPEMTVTNFNPDTVNVSQNQVVIYRLPLQEGQIVTATLTSLSGDADLYIFSPVHIDGNRTPLAASFSTGSQDQAVFQTGASGIFQIEVEGYTAAQYHLEIQIAPAASPDHRAAGNAILPSQPNSKARSVPINSSDPVAEYPIPAPYQFKQIFLPVLNR